MIEIILLLTAVLSAREVATDEPSPEVPAVAAAPVPEQDAAEITAETARETTIDIRRDIVAEPSRNAAPRRAEFIADKDPDLTAAATLAADEAEGAAAGAPAAFGLQFVRAEQRFASQGNNVRMEILRPDSDDKRPAILILHGASGIGDGAFYRSAAEIFAERGYVTFTPHYLAATPQPAAPAPKSAAKSTGKKSAASKKAAAKDPTPDGSVRAGFAVQQRILLDALDAIAANPYVDARRIGVFGMSLGGFHALNLSARDPRVAAVVNMAGALRGNNMPDHLAPTLALHGAKDAVVPVGRARTLARQLKEHGIAHDVVIYPDQGHFFRGKARTDAFQRSAGFFGQYLERPPASTTARSPGGGEPTP